MTKVRIVYSKEMRDTALPHDSNGTNGFIQPISEMYIEDENSTSIVFKLRDTSTATRFVDVWEANQKGCNGLDEEFRIDYNEFASIDNETRYRMQQDMNNVIDNINSMTNKYPIDENLKLVIGDAIQVEKLNALHRYFEDTSYDLITTKEIRESNLHSHLEIINQLVHRMEGPTTADKLFYTVIRNLQKIPIAEIYTLQDEDYMLFETSDQTGVLFLDFATVGKDLTACYATNDVALVHAKEVKQQTYCMPYFNFRFNELTENNTKDYWNDFYKENMEAYYNWCEENNVSNYYDYTQPKYRLGRIPIGDLATDINAQGYVDMTRNYPYITGVYIEKE